MTDSDPMVFSIFGSFQSNITEIVWKNKIFFFYFETRITSHFSALNSMDQSVSHFSSLLRPFCMVSESDRELIVK